MPVYVWVTVAAAVAFVLFVVAVHGGRRWWHSLAYSWARARHVAPSQADLIPGADFLGSMMLDDDRGCAVGYGWMAAPVDPEPWRQRMTAELSPEALSVHYGPGSHRPDPGGQGDVDEDYRPPLDSGLGGAAVSSEFPPGPVQAHPESWYDPDWLAAQMGELFGWVRGMVPQVTGWSVTA